MNHPHRLLALGLAATALCAPGSAFAALVTYSGGDVVATTSSAHPNSTAAAASFAAAVAGLGGGTSVNFESAPVGSFSNLTIAPGATVSGTDSNGGNQSILNASNSPAIPTLDGFNTTSGGTNFIEVKAGTVTFSFATPINAFGAYFSGLQYFYPDSLSFSDGAGQTLVIPQDGTNGSTGALSFLGFTDVGKGISSVTLTASGPNGADYIGIDDVQFASVPVATAAVPEPATWAMMLVGFGMIGTGMRYRRRIAYRPFA